MSDDKRNLETIPKGSLGLIPLASCKELGEKVDHYLVKWREKRQHEHKDTIAFKGYQSNSYIMDVSVPRFGTGEAKCVIKESVRGYDLFLLVCEADLYCAVAVVLNSLDLCYHTGTCLKNRYRNQYAVFIEDLSHSDFGCQNCFLHFSSLSAF